MMNAPYLSAVKRRRLLEELAAQGSVDVPGASPVSKWKAREILSDGTVHGKALTERQRGFFGVIASGKKPTRAKQ